MNYWKIEIEEGNKERKRGRKKENEKENVH
jgi:hypothetical protein